jgi:hypothetical protein
MHSTYICGRFGVAAIGNYAGTFAMSRRVARCCEKILMIFEVVKEMSVRLSAFVALLSC